MAAWFLEPLRNLTAEPPPGTAKARLGLRALGSGSCEIRSMGLSHRDLSPGEVLDRSRVLVLSNHYPSYLDLYRNGFLHSRVRCYRTYGPRPSVFRLRDNQALSFDQFENIDVITADAGTLDLMLSRGHYDTVAVHFLSPAMWEVLKRHIDRVRVVVWAHGVEIQPWTRRRFNFPTAEAIERARPESDARMAFWRGILKERHPNLRWSSSRASWPRPSWRIWGSASIPKASRLSTIRSIPASSNMCPRRPSSAGTSDDPALCLARLCQ